MSQPRNRIYADGNFACVGVPDDPSGDEMRKFLRYTGFCRYESADRREFIDPRESDELPTCAACRAKLEKVLRTRS